MPAFNNVDLDKKLANLQSKESLLEGSCLVR